MHRLRLAALLAATTLLAAGCTDDAPEPRIHPSPTTSPRQSAPSPLPTDTQTTPAPRVLDPEGIVRAWVAARNITVTSGSTDAVYELTASTCNSCRNLIEPFAEFYREGGHAVTRGWLVKDTAQRPDFKKSQQVVAAVKFAAGKNIDKSGATTAVYAAEKHVLEFQLKRQSDTWLVARVVFLS